MPDASVVIVTYRTPELTLRAATSALMADASEVIVVDNASGDGSHRVLDQIPDGRMIAIESLRNDGFGTAANRGARESTSGSLVFLNSDAELNLHALDLMLAELDRWGGDAIVGPRVVSTDGEVQRSAGLLPSPTDLVLRALGLHHLGRRLGGVPLLGTIIRGSRIIHEYDSSLTASSAIDTSMISGACFAIGRAAFAKLGGFDERYFMYFEDADLCRRAAAAGLPIRYVPDAHVVHVGGASSSGDYRFSPMHARSMRQYLEKWWGPPGAALALLLLWTRLIGHAITFRPGTRRAFDALRAAIG